MRSACTHRKKHFYSLQCCLWSPVLCLLALFYPLVVPPLDSLLGNLLTVPLVVPSWICCLDIYINLSSLICQSTLQQSTVPLLPQPFLLK
ncbi:hypothetical protein ILYODFUR_008989 [Ilyodon furcidens]|uniref:Uncharacterized protein n=1 Tax=Ilyodon furcidens TaxID=33524 RepID=A0ABV0V482_9TELE